MTFLVFDIETRIDKALLRATQFAGEALTDEEAYQRMAERLSADGSRGFFPLTLHVPVSIVCGTVDDRYVLRAVRDLRADRDGEEGIVRACWAELERCDGVLVSFNGRGFDLPVLELQALRWGCSAPRYFGERDGFRARYGRHFDLYDFLTNGGAARLRGGFDLLAKLSGLPGKVGTSGADVQRLWESGQCDAVHRYCRRDVIQTYFLFLRVEQLCGRLTQEDRARAEADSAPFRAELAGGDGAPG
jgi:predicted PolB exonuclease-like 3'-5' exonuclease